jgi:glycosyltransferase involved in cell wall biosynthesis
VRRPFAWAGEKVAIADSYEPHNLPAILDALDVLVVPSIWPETYGRVADEAPSRGVVVLASETGGMPERLMDGVNAFLFPPRDSDALARLLNRVIQDLPRIRSKLDFALFLPRKDQLTRKILRVISWAASSD